MKRLHNLLLVLCLMLGLVACAKAPTWQEQYDLGVRYLSEGNYEEAIIAFTAVIKIDPKRADGYVGLAEVYVGMGDAEKAAEILKQGLAQLGESKQIADMLERIIGSDSQPVELKLDGFSAEYEEGPDPYNEDSVGTMWLSCEVDAPPVMRDMLIATWNMDETFTQEKLRSDIDMMVDIWKEEGVELPNREPGVMYFQQGFPVFAEDKGKQAQVLLVGLDGQCNAVGYAVATVQIP